MLTFDQAKQIANMDNAIQTLRMENRALRKDLEKLTKILLDHLKQELVRKTAHRKELEKVK